MDKIYICGLNASLKMNLCDVTPQDGHKQACKYMYVTPELYNDVHQLRLIWISWAKLLEFHEDYLKIRSCMDNSSSSRSLPTSCDKDKDKKCIASHPVLLLLYGRRTYLTLESSPAAWIPVILDENNTAPVSDCDATEETCYAVSNDGGLYYLSINEAVEALQTLTTTSPTASIRWTSMDNRMKIHSIACGKEHVMALSRIGVVFTCGRGSRGQLGHGSSNNESSLRCVSLLEGVRVSQLSAGGWHSAALTDSGDLYTWGWNESGQLGFPCKDISSEGTSKDYVNIQLVPRVVDFPSPASGEDLHLHSDIPCTDSEDVCTCTMVSCGSRHTAVVTDSGLLYAWGWNKYGQLGVGDVISRDAPTLVPIPQTAGATAKCTAVKCSHWTTLIATG